MRKLIVILSPAAIVITIIAGDVLRSTGRTVANATSAGTAISLPQDPPGTIDGSLTPELIPDTVAYSLFFNFFLNREKNERGKLQAYISQTPLQGLSVDALIAAAAYYKERVAPIDAQVQAISDNHPQLTGRNSSTITDQLALLRSQREVVTMEVVESLSSRLGSEGAKAIRKHIDQRIKPNIKIVPGPSLTAK